MVVHHHHHHHLAVQPFNGKEIIGAMMKTILKDVNGMEGIVVVLMLKPSIVPNVNV